MTKQERAGLRIAAVWLLAMAGGGVRAATVPGMTTPAGDIAAVTLGGEVVMRLRAQAGGLSAQRRVDVITERLVQAVSVPDITPADVVVYAPTRSAPVIYVLGRRLVTVDAATLSAAGGGPARALAMRWARRLQQILPRVDIRLPNEPEPVVPADPPLTVTTDLTQVGGQTGIVTLRGKMVMRLHGLQPGGLTAAERADQVSTLLAAAAAKAAGPEAVQVVPGKDTNQAATAGLEVAGLKILTVDRVLAQAAGQPSPQALAAAWAKNIQGALSPVAANTPPPPPPAAPAETTPAPAETMPSGAGP